MTEKAVDVAGQDEPQQEMRDACVARAFASLEGLSCGDAFGECIQKAHRNATLRAARILPSAPWPYTDDTVMAVSVYACLERHGKIEPEWLAESFARHYDPERGYGHSMNALLIRIAALGAKNWFEEAQELFDGEGSFGNSAAMRVAPVGAYFAHDLHLVAENAALSAIATHCHPEAIAGAVAIAVATAVAWRQREMLDGTAMLEAVRSCTPKGAVRDGIDRAMGVPRTAATIEAALTIGNGARGTAQDTVPFALWCAARSLHRYEEALWETVNGAGEVGTNCAIAGGIVAMSAGVESIPREWLARREPLTPLLHKVLQQD
ncbi:MAG TPA: ADP-ribosylglycohydrolase family protein [Acidobacteriaceae bacterium]